MIKLTALICGLFAIAAAAATAENVFEENHMGYDQHKDLFYYQDDHVRNVYKRSKYTSTKVTLAGQHRDQTDREVANALYPFAIGQKSFIPWRVNLDRADVRDSSRFQYQAVYSGNEGDFVVNKLRAHLLRRLANAVDPLLAKLDESAAEAGQSQAAQAVLTDAIIETCRDVDMNIRKAMKPSDATSATSTVAIITEKFVVTVTVGDGRVVAHSSLGEQEELSKKLDMDTAGNVFGARKQREGSLLPSVSFRSREGEDEDGDPVDLQLLLLESPTVAGVLSNEGAFKVILGQVNQHKHQPEHEQQLYYNSVSHLLDSVAKSVSGRFIDKHRGQSDGTIIMVALETDYKSIH